MKKRSTFLAMAALALAALFLPASAAAQQASPHGISLKWNAVTQDVNGNAITGVTYILWRGTSSTGPFTQITPSPISATTYLDPASGLSPSTTYTYEVQAVSGGEDSTPVATTVAVSSAGFPVNPAGPAGFAGSVQ